MIPEAKVPFNSCFGGCSVNFAEKAYSAGNIPVPPVEKSVDDVDETYFYTRQNDRRNVIDCKKFVADCAEKS